MPYGWLTQTAVFRQSPDGGLAAPNAERGPDNVDLRSSAGVREWARQCRRTQYYMKSNHSGFAQTAAKSLLALESILLGQQQSTCTSLFTIVNWCRSGIQGGSDTKCCTRGRRLARSASHGRSRWHEVLYTATENRPSAIGQ